MSSGIRTVRTVAVFHVRSFYEVRSSVKAGWAAMFRRRLPLQEVLRRFKSGYIKRDQVDAQVKDILPNVEDFSKDWKRTTVVYPSVHLLFEQIATLNQYNIPVYLIGDIDPLQIAVIEKECGPLPGNRFLSCEKEQTGDELWAGLLEDIRQKYPLVESDDIFLHYNPALFRPWHERIGLFDGWRWLSAPLQIYHDKQKEKEIELLETRGKQGDFQAIPLDPSSHQSCDVLTHYHARKLSGPILLPTTVEYAVRRAWTPAYRSLAVQARIAEIKNEERDLFKNVKSGIKV